MQEMLESFHDETLGGLNTTRKVLVRGEEQLSETMQNYALRVRARLVVLGSSALSAVRQRHRPPAPTLCITQGSSGLNPD